MKILFCTLPFRPSVGGIETVSALLADRLHRLGHTVTLVTQSLAPSEQQTECARGAEEYRIVRRPTARQLAHFVRESDIVFHNNISLKFAWPLLLWRRPWVIAHHTWIPRTGVGRLKRMLLRQASNITVSRAMASDLPVPCVVIPNPFDATRFRPDPSRLPERDIVFVGRLVSDKGAAVLVDALAHMKASGMQATATVVGDGPEAQALKARALQLGLDDSLVFAGRCQGDELAALLQRHRVLAVPSTWEEPFGLVVLEGLACGCLPVVSESGGLPEAAGGLGHVVAKGDSRSLAKALAETLQGLDQRPMAPGSVFELARTHLQRHHPDRVTAEYLDVFRHARRRTAQDRTA